MKKWLLTNLHEISFYMGIAVILLAFFAPRHYIVVAGILMILVDDDAIKTRIEKWFPSLACKIEEWTK